MTDREVEQAIQGLRSQVNTMQRTMDAQEERIGALVENINLLRGDPQRVHAQALTDA